MSAAKTTEKKKPVARKIKLVIAQIASTQGKLADVLETLDEAGVNLCAFVCYDEEALGTAMLVPDNAEEAMRALEAAGIQELRAGEAILATVKKKKGARALLARRIAEAGINISYSFSGCGQAGSLVSVFQTNDNSAAVKALNK